MGSFCVPCAVTGIGIQYNAPVVVFAVSRKSEHHPYMLVAPPLFGVYEDYGYARDLDLDAKILGKSKREWWSPLTRPVEEGRYLCKDVVHTTQAQHRVENLLAIRLTGMVYRGSPVVTGDVEVFFVHRAVWDHKETLPMEMYNLPTYTLGELRESEDFQTFVKDEVDCILKMQSDSKEDARERMFASFYGEASHPFHMSMNAPFPPTSMTGSLLSSLLRPSSFDFAEGSPFMKEMQDFYGDYIKGNNAPDIMRDEIQSFIFMAFECLYFQYYMVLGGVSFGKRPRVPQFAQDGWDLQRKFYANVLEMLDGMIAEYDANRDE